MVVAAEGDAAAAFETLVAQDIRFVILNVPAKELVKIADLPSAQNVLIFNAGAPDDSLRNEDCRPNVLHLLPSRAMLADALAQYLVKKRWRGINISH